MADGNVADSSARRQDLAAQSAAGDLLVGYAGRGRDPFAEWRDDTGRLAGTAWPWGSSRCKSASTKSLLPLRKARRDVAQ